MRGYGQVWLKTSLYKAKNIELEKDLEYLKQEVELTKDFVLFLRPTELAGTIFIEYLEDGNVATISFEEALSRALDEPGERTVFCVGQGGERWGVAQVDFGAYWKKEIAPLFDLATTIVSLPGRSDNCLEETGLIREFPNLCQKTLFVIPPISCCRRIRKRKNPNTKEPWFVGRVLKYFGDNFSKYFESKHDVASFFCEVIIKHKRVGIYLPEIQDFTGYFATIDHKTGHVCDQREWETVTTEYTRRSVTERVEVTPRLSRKRIRHAVELAQRRRFDLAQPARAEISSDSVLLNQTHV